MSEPTDAVTAAPTHAPNDAPTIGFVSLGCASDSRSKPIVQT